MPSPKLFLYKARDAPIVAILRRGTVKTEWELIRWNTETDEFTAGQWLTKAQMNGAYCAISSDGRYFAYHYRSLREEEAHTCYAVVSELPYFSASLITDNHAGMWDGIAFTQDGAVMHTQARKGFTMKRACSLPISPVYDTALMYKGACESGSFTDARGRALTVVGGAIYVDGSLLYDTAEHTFKSVACPEEELEEKLVVKPKIEA
jgi:hypothetical protein